MIAWAVDAVLATALLMAAALLLRRPVRRLFGPTVAYALWALPAARLLLPPLPETWREAATTPISRASELVVHVVASPPAADPALGQSAAGFVALAWMLGAAAFLLFHLIQYAVFRARLLRRHQPVRRVGGVRVVLSPAAPGPLAFGVLSRYVALPADLDARYDTDEQALALAHELGHHARGDLLANWVALAMLALHWWNPLAWFAHRAFRADQELANDARVLRERGPDAAHAYACAILKAAHGGAIAAACHLHTINDLKGRIRMLKSGPASPRRLLAGAVTVTLVAAAGLGLTASGTGAAAAVKSGVGDTIGVDLDAQVETAFAELRAAEDDLAEAGADLADAREAAQEAAVASPDGPPDPIPPLSPVPPVPGIAPVPPVPPVPPAPSIAGDRHVTVIKDKDGRVRRIVRERDGELVHMDVPRIIERECGGGDRPTVINKGRGGERLTIICTDRIERMAERHAELAANSRDIERNALRSALEGLRGARSAIEGNPQLTADQRREALQGLDEGEREIRENLDRAD